MNQRSQKRQFYYYFTSFAYKKFYRSDVCLKNLETTPRTELKDFLECYTK